MPIGEVQAQPRNTERLKEIVKNIAKPIGALALAVVAVSGAYLGFADSKIDILGDYPPKIRTEKEMKAIADKEAANLLLGSTEASRFKLLFLQNKNDNLRSKIEVSSVVGGKGILGFVGDFKHSDPYRRTYGQTCLTGSPFDIRPKSERPYWDDAPQATLSIDPLDGEVLVYPANSPAPPLRFIESEEGLLRPDSGTKATLIANGCSDETKM